MSVKTVDIQRATDINGWMSEEELTWLAEQAETRDVIIEMGSYQGRSTRALGDHARGIVYAWDHWQGPDEPWWKDVTSEEYRKNLFTRFTFNLMDLLDSGKVRAINAPHECSPADLPQNPDMIFIDGDHTYEAVKRDIKRWLPISPGCLLCGHDWNQAPVRQAVQEMLPIDKPTIGSIWSLIG